ncbi:hypothetical protein Syun_017052 [Stephania yunnanensis]|uniref:Uncharacterized protein n=1 Tax=Stephania yunnanensis TaxID=152371 RepID=A0AAP0J754_9MAGN
MISGWLSKSTTQQPLQEDMQHVKSKSQNSKTQVTAILEHLMDEEELPPQPIFDSDETVNADTSKSVEFDEFSIVDEHLSEPEETLDVSSHEPDIIIAQYDDDEAEKEIEVPNELRTLKEGVHDALPKYVDAPFVVDISKGEGIT